MTDKQIKRYQRLSQFAGLAMLLFGAVAAFDWLGAIVVFGTVSVTQIFTGLGVLTGVLSRWASQQLPSAKPPSIPVGPVAILLLALGLMVSAGCKGAGWRALDATQNARDLTAKQLASAVATKHAECKKAHGVKTEAFAACIKKHRAALDSWIKIARPVINDSIAITAAALQIADKVGKKANWIDLLKPAACAISRSVKAFGHYFADKAAGVLSALSLIDGVTCE